MNNTKSAIMITLFSCMGQGEKHYSKVSIDKIRTLIKDFHGIHVKRRWIFYCLSYLIDEKLISKKKRYLNDHNGLIAQIPSLHAFTLKGMKYLVSKRVTGAWKVLKSMIKYVMKKDGRWPVQNDIGDEAWLPADPESKEGLKKLLGLVTKRIE